MLRGCEAGEIACVDSQDDLLARVAPCLDEGAQDGALLLWSSRPRTAGSLLSQDRTWASESAWEPPQPRGRLRPPQPALSFQAPHFDQDRVRSLPPLCEGQKSRQVSIKAPQVTRQLGDRRTPGLRPLALGLPDSPQDEIERARVGQAAPQRVHDLAVDPVGAKSQPPSEQACLPRTRLARHRVVAEIHAAPDHRAGSPCSAHRRKRSGASR